MSKNGVERVLNRLKMAGHLIVATICSQGQFPMALLACGQSLMPFVNG